MRGYKRKNESFEFNPTNLMKSLVVNASCCKIDLMNHVFEKGSIGFSSQDGSEFNQIEGKIHEEVEKIVTQDKSLDENSILLYMKEKSMNKKSNTKSFTLLLSITSKVILHQGDMVQSKFARYLPMNL